MSQDQKRNPAQDKEMEELKKVHEKTLEGLNLQNEGYRCYKFDTCDAIIRIKDFHGKVCADTWLIEIDDYCGRFDYLLSFHWYLNNFNMIFEASGHYLDNDL